MSVGLADIKAQLEAIEAHAKDLQAHFASLPEGAPDDECDEHMDKLLHLITAAQSANHEAWMTTFRLRDKYHNQLRKSLLKNVLRQYASVAETLWEIYWRLGKNSGCKVLSAASEGEARILFRQLYPRRVIERTRGPIREDAQ